MRAEGVPKDMYTGPIEARWYATFHHIGVIEGRAAFLERLDRYVAVIADRERRLLEYLAEPRSLDEIAAHRFVYRPQDPVPFAEPVERRSMAQHVAFRSRFQMLVGSRIDRSWIQPKKGAWRISMVTDSTLYSA